MIIGVLNQKGGVGKTTLSINIAACLARNDLSVLLVDADPQASALTWSSVRDADPIFPVIGMAKPTLHKDLPGVASKYDAVIIDGAPRVNELGRAVIMASDVIVIPVQPSPYDVWAAEETCTLVKEAQVYKDNLRSVFAINRKIANTVIGREVTAALTDFDTPVAKQQITQRVIYAESAATGQTVFDVAPDGDAANEITSLAHELWKHQMELAA